MVALAAPTGHRPLTLGFLLFVTCYGQSGGSAVTYDCEIANGGESGDWARWPMNESDNVSAPGRKWAAWSRLSHGRVRIPGIVSDMRCSQIPSRLHRCNIGGVIPMGRSGQSRGLSLVCDCRTHDGYAWLCKRESERVERPLSLSSHKYPDNALGGKWEGNCPSAEKLQRTQSVYSTGCTVLDCQLRRRNSGYPLRTGRDGSREGGGSAEVRSERGRMGHGVGTSIQSSS
ncbi:hypothetical protein H6P81_001081 [Aristolochia fimbriata]|uniref:Uncharacterized protein n=1 Tax=Aristolochia fimbriata TaxID=158543 RepID=A0AAV7FAH2_ARIFI|nr:hypothetical protein H6P81_001081 [Aristolochia fimbriata]